MDCMEFLKKQPDQSYDLAIVDPPYGGGATKVEGNGLYDVHTYTTFRTGGRWYKRYRINGDYKITSWDVAPSPEYFTQLFRVAKYWIIWGANYFSLPPCKCFIVWRKRGLADTFKMGMAELAYSNINCVSKVFECVTQGTLKNPRIHPTQKPIALYEWLLDLFAKPNYKILDTHVGSGSIRIACFNKHLSFTGTEIDKYYYDKQEERFNAYASVHGGDLF